LPFQKNLNGLGSTSRHGCHIPTRSPVFTNARGLQVVAVQFELWEALRARLQADVGVDLLMNARFEE